MELRKYKVLIENGLVFVGTSANKGLPNITVVDGALLLNDSRVLIADVLMTSCKKNLLSNHNCCMLIFDFKKNIGLKVFGKAEYFTNGLEFEMVQEKLKSTRYKAKGAFAILAEKIIEVK